jgi:hypothetical protein
MIGLLQGPGNEGLRVRDRGNQVFTTREIRGNCGRQRATRAMGTFDLHPGRTKFADGLEIAESIDGRWGFFLVATGEQDRTVELLGEEHGIDLMRHFGKFLRFGPIWGHYRGEGEEAFPVGTENLGG